MTCDLTTRRINGPAELLAAIPYLLGFRPSDSVVVVGLRANRLVVTARLDLAAVLGHGDRSEVASTIEAMAAGGTEDLVVVVYDVVGPDALPRPSRWAGVDHDVAGDVLEAVQESAGARRIVDALYVHGDRWWSIGCDVRSCCPPEGRALPTTPTPFAAAATVAGVVPLASREHLAGTLVGQPRHVRDLLRSQLAAEARSNDADQLDEVTQRAAIRDLRAAAGADDGAGDAVPTRAQVLHLARALTCTAVRDAVWLTIDDGRLDGRALWRSLAGQLPAPWDAPPMFLFAWATWRHGDGALARIAADRVVASDPSYTAADLLLAVLANGVDPRRMPRLRRDA